MYHLSERRSILRMHEKRCSMQLLRRRVTKVYTNRAKLFDKLSPAKFNVTYPPALNSTRTLRVKLKLHVTRCEREIRRYMRYDQRNLPAR